MGEVTGNITVLPPALHSVERRGDAGRKLRFSAHRHGGHDPGRSTATDLPPAPRARSACAARACSPATTTIRRRPRRRPRIGWFHTGDLGHMDARGFVYITGRASDMYISGGSNVYPREIEEALLLHPAVAEACVVGMPHEKWGESGVAVLVLEPGATRRRRTLLAHLDGRLAKYKWPQRVCRLAGTAEIRLRQGDQARRETSVAGGRVMATPPVDPARINDYHVHVYYDPRKPGPRRDCCGSGWRNVSQCAWEAGTTSRSGRMSPAMYQIAVHAGSVPDAGAVPDDEPHGADDPAASAIGPPARRSHASTRSGWARCCR